MHPDVKEIMFSESEIKNKIKELGERISNDYKECESITVVGILKGAVIFMSDLVRSISVPVFFDFMAVSSYSSSTESSGVVRILKDLDKNVESKHVLIVEDIVDTGLTLNYLINNLRNRNVVSLKVCTLLDKPSRRKVDVRIDYNGFEIPDEFVVGYGLDFNECYRNLPYIAVLKPEVYRK
ncbi:hypoxanthine phosphoribosyltransferase [Peptococcaceae bacterium]|nr:hypoxanthine phosphoribosyltransferase [Peptococcaceae bacterium]